MEIFLLVLFIIIIADTMITQISDSWEASIFLFFFVGSGLMEIIFNWLGGLVIFIDDYANAIFVGSSFRPLSDKYKIFRKKFPYILDSTAAPVSAMFLISTWTGY